MLPRHWGSFGQYAVGINCSKTLYKHQKPNDAVGSSFYASKGKPKGALRYDYNGETSKRKRDEASRRKSNRVAQHSCGRKGEGQGRDGLCHVCRRVCPDADVANGNIRFIDLFKRQRSGQRPVTLSRCSAKGQWAIGLMNTTWRCSVGSAM